MIRTPKLKMPYMTNGSIYSASIDEERSVHIDSLLNVLSELIGDGIIQGWEINEDNDLDIKISKGSGIINKQFSQSISEIIETVNDNDINYIYVTPNANIVSGEGAASIKKEILYIDTNAPSAPANLSLDEKTFSSISFEWDQNFEEDILKYNIYRKKDTEINFSIISSVLHIDGNNTISFKDTSLTPETQYEYKITSIDKSENESGFSNIISVTTNTTFSKLNEVTNLKVRTSNKFISAFWSHPNVNLVDSFIVFLSKLDENQSPINTIKYNVGKKLFININNLENNTLYNLTVKVKDKFDNISQGISKTFSPIFIDSPEEVENISFNIDNMATIKSITPRVQLFWDKSNADKYKIEIIKDSLNTIPINVGNNDSKNLVTFGIKKDGKTVNTLFEDNSEYIIRIISIFNDGRESEGSYIKIKIPDFTPPSKVGNFIASSKDSSADLSWNQSDSPDLDNYELAFWKVEDEENFVENVDFGNRTDNKFTLVSGQSFSNNYPIGSWVEVKKISSNGPNIKLITSSPISSGDTFVEVENIPLYYDRLGSIKITNPQNVENIGNTTNKTINGLENDKEYKFIITSIDLNGLRSDGAIAKTVVSENNVILPHPNSFSISSSDKENIVSWESVNFSDGYNVYRAKLDYTEQEAFIEDQFLFLTKVEGSSSTFIRDINLDNLQKYSYVITSTLNNKESEFSIENQVIGMPVSSAKPMPPDDVTLSSQSDHIEITWNFPDDLSNIDGWILYKSTKEFNDFSKIATLEFSTLSFKDFNVNGGVKYYYFIKSFSNTIDIEIETELKNDKNFLLIGEIETNNGKIKNITPNRNIIKNLNQKIENLTLDFIKSHKHSVSPQNVIINNSNSNSEKISLSDFIIDEWEPNNDFQIYTTNINVIDSYPFIVLVNNKITDIFHEVDVENNKIIFSEPLNENDNILLKYIGLREVQGILNEAFVEELDSSVFSTGKFKRELIPDISHNGLLNQKAIVESFKLLSDDNIFYDLNSVSFLKNEENINIIIDKKSTSFYDFIKVNNILYGASSRGILKSEDEGISWKNFVSFDTLITRFYQSIDGFTYYAIGRDSVFISIDEMQSWQPMNGLNSIGIINSFIEDDDKNFYLTTDVGIYKFDQNFRRLYEFTFLPLFSNNLSVSEVFSIIYKDGKLIISTEQGVLSSIDSGNSWTISNDIRTLYKMSFFKKYIIAIRDEDGKLYKTIDGNYWVEINSNIRNFEKRDILSVINDRIFITNNKGIYYSDDSENFSLINGEFNKNIDKQTAISFYGNNKNDVILSFDNILYKFFNKSTFIWSEFDAKAPSIFLNNEILLKGYHYDSLNNNIYFDFKNKADDILSVGFKYDTYIIESQGWEDINGNDSVIELFINNLFIDEIKTSELADDNIQKNDEKIVNRQYIFEYNSSFITINSETGIVEINNEIFSKLDKISFNIKGVSLFNEGSLSHSQIENLLDKKNVGMDFNLNTSYLHNLLQMGLGIEHNFIESVTDAIYPYSDRPNIRSLNSELINSDFFIFGSKPYDVFNSTVDYIKIQSTENFIENPFIINDIKEINEKTWILTDKNIYELDYSRKKIDRQIFINNNSFLNVKSVFDNDNAIYIVANDSIYKTEDFGYTWEKNLGFGLPSEIFEIIVFKNLLVVSTNDGIYTSNINSDEWRETNLSGVATKNLTKSNFIYCTVNNTIYKSTNALSWTEASSFNSNITGLHVKNQSILISTNEGIFTDNSTLNSKNSFSFKKFNINNEDNLFIRDIAIFKDTIFAISENTIYKSIDSGKNWVVSTIVNSKSLDAIHIWPYVVIKSNYITELINSGLPNNIATKLFSIKDVKFDTTEDLRNEIEGILTEKEFSNNIDLIMSNPFFSSEENLLSSFLNILFLINDNNFITIGESVLLYNNILEQDINVSSDINKVSLYLNIKKIKSKKFNIYLQLVGNDGTTFVIDTKSSNDLTIDGFYNFAININNGFSGKLRLTQTDGDENSTVLWKKNKNNNFVYQLWQFNDAVNEEDQTLTTNVSESEIIDVDISEGEFDNTVFENDKVILNEEENLLSFIIDQSGSMTWNDREKERFKLIEQYASNLNNLYPGELNYSISLLESSIFNNLKIELVDNDDRDGSFYQIVRRTDRFPNSPLDGEVVAKTSLTVFKDKDLLPNTEYYYSIFNIREDETIISKQKKSKITTNLKQIPLPASNLELKEEIVEEIVNSSLIDTGKRNIILSYYPIENFSQYYNEVRILRKTIFSPEEIIENKDDGDIIFEGNIIQGENIFVDDFSGNSDPINGVIYRYAIFTKNSLGNYNLPRNSLQSNIEISSVWREWNFDDSFNSADIPTEFSQNVDVIEDFSITNGNGQALLEWTLPSNASASIIVASEQDEENQLDENFIDKQAFELKNASPPNDFEGSIPSISSNIIYIGNDESFVHRNIENDSKIKYTIYSFNRVRTLSDPIVGESSPKKDIVDEIRPPEAMNFHTEILNEETIILRWEKEEIENNDIIYFDDTVTVKFFALDEDGASVGNIENFDFIINEKNGNKLNSLNFDGKIFNRKVKVPSPNFLINFNRDFTNIDNEIRLNSNVNGQANRLSIYESLFASINGQFKIKGNDRDFIIKTDPLTVSFNNPINANIFNKFPQNQSVKIQREVTNPLTGEVQEEVFSLNGIYIRRGQSYFGSIEFKFKNKNISNSNLSDLNISINVYELKERLVKKDGIIELIWEQSPSNKVIPKNNTLTPKNISENNEIKTIADFELNPPDQEVTTIVVANINYKGYQRRVEHQVDFKNILNIELNLEAPIGNGLDVAEQKAQVSIGPPLFDDDFEEERPSVPDGVIVKWEMTKRTNAQDRPFFSVENVGEGSGVFSSVRNGVARNVFFGPASDIQSGFTTDDAGLPIFVGEIYNIKATVIYDGMTETVEDQIEILPVGDESSDNFIFYMTHFSPIRGKTIFADGEDSVEIKAFSDPTGVEGEDDFVECVNTTNKSTVVLDDDQDISINISSENQSDIKKFFDFNGETYNDENDFPFHLINGIGEFNFRANSFIGPPPDEPVELPDLEGLINECYGRIPLKPEYPPEIIISGETNIILDNESVKAVGGGERSKGTPPISIILKEPLSINYEKMISKGQAVSNPLNDGKSKTDFIFNVSFSEKNIPEGVPIEFELLLGVKESKDSEPSNSSLGNFKNEKELFNFIKLESNISLTEIENGQSIVKATLLPTNISSNINLTLVAKTTYDKLGTIDREMFAFKPFVIFDLSDTKVNNNLFSNKVERYNPSNDNWDVLEETNIGRFGSISEEYNDKIYLSGGFTAFGLTNSLEVFEYNNVITKSKVNGEFGSWSEKESMLFPRAYAQSIIYGDTIYVLGGSGFDPLNPNRGSINAIPICEKYDINNDTWTEISRMPVPVSNGISHIVGNDIFVLTGITDLTFDGDNSQIAQLNNFILKYNIINDEWEIIEEFSFNDDIIRYSANSYLNGNSIYIFNGAKDNIKSLENLNDTKLNDSFIKVDLSDISNINVTNLNFNNNDNIKLFRSTSVLLSNKLYNFGGSGIKNRDVNGVNREFKTFTLRSLEKLDINSLSWQKFTNFSKMTYERHSLSSSVDSDNFIYAICGAGSGYEPGKLFIDINFEKFSDISNKRFRADGRDQTIINVTALDTTGEPPNDVKAKIGGFVNFNTNDEENEENEENENRERVENNIKDKISIIPVLFSSNDLNIKDGQASTVLLERSEDPISSINNLKNFVSQSEIDFVKQFDTSLNEESNKIAQDIIISTDEERVLYSIDIDLSIEDDFYFGSINSFSFDNENNEKISNSSSSSQLSLQTQSSANSIEVFSDIIWAPRVKIFDEIMDFDNFIEQINFIKQEIPFGGSPLYDAIVKNSNEILNKESVSSIRKSILCLTDNEENLSESTVDDAILSIQSIDGHGEIPFISTVVSTSKPVSVSARESRSDVIDLEKIAIETNGRSYTILDSSFVKPVLSKIKKESIGSIGHGVYEKIIDFNKEVFIESIESEFELFNFTDASISVSYSINGFEFKDLNINIDPNEKVDINRTLKFLKIRVNLLSEFGDNSLMASVPPPALCQLIVKFFNKSEKFLYTFSKDIDDKVKEFVIALNSEIPSLNSIDIGISHGNSTLWDDYLPKNKMSNKGARFFEINRDLNTFNLFNSNEGGATFNSKTFDDIKREWILDAQEKENKLIDDIVILGDSGDGETKIIFADGSEKIVQDAPDFSLISESSNISTVFNYDFMKSDDGYIYKSTYGPWNSNAKVDVFRDNVLLNPNEFLTFPQKGLIKFIEKQNENNDIVLNVIEPSNFRVGFKLNILDNNEPTILHDFAYLYSSKFIRNNLSTNSLPEANNLSILPNVIETDSNIKASYEYVDEDNDQEAQSEIQWFINNEHISILDNKIEWNNNDLESFNLNKGDKIYFTIRPFDGKEFGVKKVSNSKSINYNGPMAINLTIKPLINNSPVNIATSSADLVADYTYFDAQGFKESGTIIEWILNGEVIDPITDFKDIIRSFSNTIDGVPIVEEGNRIQVRVTPSNNITIGNTSVSSEIVIQNSAPSISNLSLDPGNPIPSSVLSASYEFIDNDGDEDNSIIKWFKNNKEVKELENRISISSDDLNSGDTWFVEVTPFDGKNFSDPVRTSIVEIG